MHRPHIKTTRLSSLVLVLSFLSSHNGGPVYIVEQFYMSAPVSAIRIYSDDLFFSPHAAPCTSQVRS